MKKNKGTMDFRGATKRSKGARIKGEKKARKFGALTPLFLYFNAVLSKSPSRCDSQIPNPKKNRSEAGKSDLHKNTRKCIW